MNALPDVQKPPARARDVRFVSVEPGRISLHGVALTDGEYAVLRGIAERMKHAPALRAFEELQREVAA